MPFPIHARFWLPADVRRAADDFDAQLGGFLSNEHKDDGSHRAITADSLSVSQLPADGSALRVDGNAEFGLFGVTHLFIRGDNGNITMTAAAAQPASLDLIAPAGFSARVRLKDENGLDIWTIGTNVTDTARSYEIYNTTNATKWFSITEAGLTSLLGTIKATGLPTSAGAAGTLWVDTAGGLNIVKRV